MLTVKVFCFIAGCVSVSGFMFDDPCDVFPRYQSGIPDSSEFTTTVNVPANCRNGTFRWDYPRGHTMLHFRNSHEVATTICIKDDLGGDVFNITSKATHERLGKFDYKHWACLKASTAPDIVLQVDAPLELRYMGEVAYKITN